MKQKYDWEKYDLELGDDKVDKDHVSKFTHICAKILGVPMEAHIQPDDGAEHAPPVPTMSYLDTAAWANTGIAPTTGVSQTTGVGPIYNVVDLTYASDDDDNTVMVPMVEVLPKVKDVIDEETHVEDDMDIEEPAQDGTPQVWSGNEKACKTGIV